MGAGQKEKETKTIPSKKEKDAPDGVQPPCTSGVHPPEILPSLMFAVLTLVPAAPAVTEPCTCALNWTDPDSGHACSEPQSGCPPVACDGPYPPWCVVESLPCADPDPDSGINTGLYGGNWIHCEPEYSPTPPKSPPPPEYPPPPPFAVVRIGALLPRQLPSGELMHLGRAEELTSVLMAIEEINNKTDGVADDLLPNTQLLARTTATRAATRHFGSDAAYQLLHVTRSTAPACDALVSVHTAQARPSPLRGWRS